MAITSCRTPANPPRTPTPDALTGSNTGSNHSHAASASSTSARSGTNGGGGHSSTTSHSGSGTGPGAKRAKASPSTGSLHRFGTAVTGFFQSMSRRGSRENMASTSSLFSDGKVENGSVDCLRGASDLFG